MKTNIILNGDAIEHMKKLPENSVDAIITDPPYGLEFMGKEWDKFKKGENIAGGTKAGKDTPFGRSKPLNSVYQYSNEQKLQMQLFFQEWATQCLRVLKPGGFLLSFGGTRTYHRLVCGIEDAGFEIRDTIMWLYGSGFPKSLNIGKQIDKIQGNEREKIGRYKRPDGTNVSLKGTENPCFASRGGMEESVLDLTKGNSEWEGWGTALKPACEPIVVARKPLSEKNVALNVLKWGTGGINIDDCRIGIDFENEKNLRDSHNHKQTAPLTNNAYGDYKTRLHQDKGFHNSQGRFPANIILDEEAGKMLDEQSGELTSGKMNGIYKGSYTFLNDGIIYGKNKNNQIRDKSKGGASRFFYCAKASKSERNFGLENTRVKNTRPQGVAYTNEAHIHSDMEKQSNSHPTVKPIKLMEYLIKLVSRKGAIVLDPFLGSGTTAIACLKLNRFFIGIEKEEEYVKIAKARIKPFLEQRKIK